MLLPTWNCTNWNKLEDRVQILVSCLNQVNRDSCAACYIQCSIPKKDILDKFLILITLDNWKCNLVVKLFKCKSQICHPVHHFMLTYIRDASFPAIVGIPAIWLTFLQLTRITTNATTDFQTFTSKIVDDHLHYWYIYTYLKGSCIGVCKTVAL